MRKSLRISTLGLILTQNLYSLDATSWSEFGASVTGEGTVTINNNSTLKVTLNENSYFGTQKFRGNIILNSNFSITATLSGYTDRERNFTSLYNLREGNKSFITNTDQILSLDLKGKTSAKSIFNVERAGTTLDISTLTKVSVEKNLKVFSIFRSADEGKITFNQGLEVDLSNATSGFVTNEMKTIFDIDRGIISLNPNSSNQHHYKLKGDIYSIGTFEGNFSTASSYLEGKMLLEQSSKTQLDFNNGAKANLNILSKDSSALTLQFQSSTLSGTLLADNNSINTISLSNQAQGILNSTFKENSKAIFNLSSQATLSGDITLGDALSNNSSKADAQINLTNGKLLGNITSYTHTTHKITATSKGSYHGNIDLHNNATNTLNFSDSSSLGLQEPTSHSTLTLQDSASSEIILKNQASAFLNLILKNSSKLTLSASDQAQFVGNINLNGYGGTIDDPNNPRIKFSFDTQSEALIENLTFSGSPNFVFNINSSSQVLIRNATFTQNARTNQADFNLSSAKFYANFTQSRQNYQGKISLSNSSEWITSINSKIDEIYFAPSRSTNGNKVNLLYSNLDLDSKNLTPRSLSTINSSNRLTLEANKITGENGIFALYGILNPTLWSKEGEKTIATDIVIAKDSVNGTHNLHFYWDSKNIDKTLTLEKLQEAHIVVAQQYSKEEKGGFVGFSIVDSKEYETPLKRVDLINANGENIGYEWIIGSDTPTPPPTPEPIPPTPSPPPPKLPAQQLLAQTLNSLFTSAYKLFVFESETLHQRMGDLRYFDSMGGSYVKFKYGLIEVSKTSEALSSLSMDSRITLGGDYGFYSYGGGGKGFLGAAFDIGVMQDFGGEFQGAKQAYSGESVSYGFSVYETNLFDNGIYIDSVLKYILGSHTYNLSSPELKDLKFVFLSHSLLASFEMGYKMRLPIATPHFDYSFYYIKPQFNLVIGNLFGSHNLSFVHSKGYNLSAKTLYAIPVSPALSFDLGRRFDNDKILGDIFLSLGAEYTFNAGNPLKVIIPQQEMINAQSRVFEQEDVFNLKFGVGGNVIFKNGTRIYYSLNSKFLGRVQPVLDMNIGVRIPFGGKIKRVGVEEREVKELEIYGR